MRRCEICMNEYDKAFEVTMAGKATFTTVSSVPFMPLPRAAHIATAKLSAMALKYRELCIAARIAPTKKRAPKSRIEPRNLSESCHSAAANLRRCSDGTAPLFQ
jgi:hypothetical protein